jgi:hypothetical protein
MKKKLVSPFFIAFILFTTVFSACDGYTSEAERSEAQRPIPPPRPPVVAPRPKYVQKFASTTFDLTTETGEFGNRVFTRLNEENFEWLEQTASKARKNKEIMKGGYWKIKAFYDSLRPKNNKDDEYKSYFERLNRWKNAYPESITPRVAIADGWQNYAFEARGGGYADTVTQDGWRLFSERMQNSKRELLEARDLKEGCPYWYSSLLEIAKDESWEDKDFEALYQEAIAFEPGYYYFHRQKALNLLPRYGGRPGQFEAFLDDLYEKKGAQNYYLTLSYFILEVGEMPFDRDKYSTERAKQGFEELRRTAGVDRGRLNDFAKFAFLASDFSTASEIFKEIGEDWDIGTWEDKTKFENYRRLNEMAAQGNTVNHQQPNGSKRF